MQLCQQDSEVCGASSDLLTDLIDKFPMATKAKRKEKLSKFEKTQHFSILTCYNLNDDRI